jgi:RNA polymerase sigma-70 factor (ECF subfamily)
MKSPLLLLKPRAQSPGQASAAAGVEAWRAGSTLAIVGLYDQYHQRVRRLARRLLGDDAAAEDVVQEVFLSLPKALRGFRGESDVLSFLLGMSVKRARGQLRVAMRRRRLLERYAAEERPRPRDPEQELAQRELARQLLDAMDSLSISHREAFVLCELEKLSSGEAARVLGIPEGTVRTRRFYAREKLRERLEREGL